MNLMPCFLVKIGKNSQKRIWLKTHVVKPFSWLRHLAYLVQGWWGTIHCTQKMKKSAIFFGVGYDYFKG